jgi:hypothetical protein
MRLVQLRLKLVIARWPRVSASGPCPKHGPHQLWRMPPPTERKTAAIDSPSSRGSGCSIWRFTPPEPGKITNSRAARVSPWARAALSTSAADSRSS